MSGLPPAMPFIAERAAARAITAREIVSCERVAFLTRQVGAFKVTFERSVVRMLTALCDGGTLGPWGFVALSNGGGYLRPPAKRYTIQAPNYAIARVSCDTAGILATLYALADLKACYRAEGIFELRFAQLRDYARAHPDARQIFLLFEL